MALYHKTIVRPNVYSIKTPAGRRIRSITKSDLKEIAETNNKIIESGYKIPAPYAHRDSKGIIPSILADENTDASTKEKKQWSSDLNAGYWTKFEITPKGELAGYLEVPDDNDKIGKTIKETSVFMVPEWEDGLGRKWKKALLHVALVTNAVEPNQENFELVDPSPEYSLAMAFSLSDAVAMSDDPNEDQANKSPSETSDTSKEQNKSDDSNSNDKEKTGTGNVPEIVALLKDKLGYELPGDTTPENFLDRLRTLLTSIKKEEEEEEQNFPKNPKTNDKPGGNDSEVKSSPIAMSDDNKDNLVILEKKVPKLLEKLVASLKASLTSRIQAAVAAGKIGKKYADTILYPQVEALVMSLDDLNEETGEFPKTEVEIRLEMAEDLNGFMDKDESELPKGSFVPNVPEGGEESMTKEELERAYSYVS